MRPYYDEDGITIYCGDCREIAAPSMADTLLSDPPYGISHPTDYAKRGRGSLAQCKDYPPVYGDSEPFDPTPWLDFDRVALFGANYYADRLPPQSGWFVWDKLRPELLDQAAAELAWTNCVKGVRVFRHLWNGMMRASERGSNLHPTQKPVALMEWCLSWMGGDLVLDPFMGSGTTLVAAKQLGRRAIGIEIEERYCEIAVERLRQTVMRFEEPKREPEQPGMFP